MNHKTVKKISVIIVILIIAILIFFIYDKTITGKITETNYSYTKAICNSTNFCQDYEITCENSKIKEVKPITGAIIQNSDDWKDPRNNETINKLC
jgi:hypothetical protein